MRDRAPDPRPSPIVVAWSVFRVLRSTSPPAQSGRRAADGARVSPEVWDPFATALVALADGGLAALVGSQTFAAQRAALRGVDPDRLSRPHAIAFWLNLYNLGALEMAARAYEAGVASVLRLPDPFARPVFDIAGEPLSLDAVEHGKLRRLGEPRIHGALICGSASCPSVRHRPFDGDRATEELDDQMRRFLADGAYRRQGRTVTLSRIFLWFGADLVRPHRMPAWLPPRRETVLRALLPWLPAEERAVLSTGHVRVRFQPYDWGLGCQVQRPGSPS